MTKRACLGGLCLLAALVALCATASAQGRWAIICGVADYKSINDLQYTDDDALDMAAALRQYPEWNQTPDQIVLLIDSAASKQGVQNAIQLIGSKAAADDVCLFFFSGHGTQVRDTSGEEADRYDEAICPWDTSTASTVITDDELASWLSTSLRTQQVVVILDTCFSGGMAKAKDVTVKSVSMPGVPDDAVTRRPFGSGLARRLAMRGKPGGGGGGSSTDIGGTNSVVLMACEESKLSYETPALQNGVFSYYVVQGLGSPAAKAPADGDANGTVAAEEDYAYAAPRTTSYARTYLRVKQNPRLYDGNPYAQAALVTTPLAGAKVTVTTEKASYASGEKLRATVQMRDAHGAPVEGAVIEVAIETAAGGQIAYQGITDSAGAATFAWTVSSKAGGKGTYRVLATVVADGAAGTASTTFGVN